MTLALVPGFEGGEPEQPVPRETVAVMADMSGLPDEAPPHWGVDFWIADTDAAVAKATELGGKVVNPPTETPASARPSSPIPRARSLRSASS